MNLEQKIESLLLVSTKPLSMKKIVLLTDTSLEAAEVAVHSLMERYSTHDRGMILLRNQDAIQLATHPELSPLIQEYLKEDISGELTRVAFETLSVIAYRGPVTKGEIEQIRGVNCSLSLRNLMIRGLVEVKDDKKRGEKLYTLSFDFLRHLGVQSVAELPEYERLHAHEKLDGLLSE